MKALDLFSGIGGMTIGMEAAGIETIAFCEINKFCQGELKRNWPHVPIIRDIKTLNGCEFKNGYGHVDIVTAGVPCQPASIIGKRKGINDSRWLWPDTLRVIKEIKPTWIICENPVGILTLNQGKEFGEILERLGKAGYVVWWETIPASSVGAGHRRERVFIIAYSSRKGLERHAGNGEVKRQAKPNRPITPPLIFPIRDSKQWWQDKSPVPIVVDGVSDPALWKEQIIATGNAVIPKIIETICNGIKGVQNVF